MTEWLMPIYKEKQTKYHWSLVVITILTIAMIGFLYLHFNSTPSFPKENPTNLESPSKTNPTISLARIKANGTIFEGKEGIEEFRELYRKGELPGIGFPQGAN